MLQKQGENEHRSSEQTGTHTSFFTPFIMSTDQRQYFMSVQETAQDGSEKSRYGRKPQVEVQD
jgi:hypothetical protein